MSEGGDEDRRSSNEVDDSIEQIESSSEQCIRFEACLARSTGFRPTTESAKELVGDSAYVLFLTENPFAMFAAVAVFAVQVAILVVFGSVNWMAEKRPDLNPGYMFLMVLVLFFHTGGEMAKGLQLIVMSAKSKDTISCINVLALGIAIGGIACGTIGVAINYVSKKSDDFVSAVQDIFILLFVLDCDEKVFDIIRYWNPDCAKELLVSEKAQAEDHEGDDK